MPILSAAQRVQNTDMLDFKKWSKEEQREFISQIEVIELKRPKDLPVLKKFIAMKVLMEVRHAVENKSALNLTALFRNVLAFFGLGELRMDTDFYELYSGERPNDIPQNGYNCFHISDMGLIHWNRKFFHIGVDKENNIITKETNTSCNIRRGLLLEHSEPKIWSNLDHDSEQLKNLLAEIKKQTQYENTLGYDLLSAVMFCLNGLVVLSAYTRLFALVLTPLALVLSTAIYALVIPATLTLSTLEHLIINPVKWIIHALQKDEHEAFIKAVTDDKRPSFFEVRKNAIVLKKAFEGKSHLNGVGLDALSSIAAFTGDSESYTADEAEEIARKNLGAC